MDNLYFNLKKFNYKINKEILRLVNKKSEDDKLEILISKILDKRKKGENNNNQKLVIFTVYRDSAIYLFAQLKKRGFDKLAMVTGSESQTDDSNEITKDFEQILERFAPYTKTIS